MLATLLTPTPHTHAASVIYVNAAASGTGDGSSWANAYASLQAALANASSGSEIWVAKGTYRPAGPGGDRNTSFVLKSGVALYSGFVGNETEREQRDWAANLAILSGDLNGDDGPNFANNGENSFHVVQGGGADGTTILDGFTISGGNGNISGSCPTSCGGGIYNESSSPTLINLTISGNSSPQGGGMFNGESSSPMLINVTLSGNSAHTGGGMGNNNSSNPTLTNVTLSGNSASFAGGMFNGESSSPTLRDVTLSGNSAFYEGGGMHNYNNSNPTLINVTLSGNSAHYGGGMYNYVRSSPTLTNVTLSGNTAKGAGGGMQNLASSNPTLTNVTLSGNSAQSNGGGMENYYSNPTLTNVTLSGNTAQRQGGGIENYNSSPTVQNSIVWGNAAPNGSQIFNIDNQSTPTVRTSIVQGGYISGSAIIDADPLFVAPIAATSAPTTTGDLRLRPASPAIDAGDTALLPATLTADRDGLPRRVGRSVDLGAFEARPQLSLTKTADVASASPSQRLTYRLVLRNTGAYTSTASLSDTLPSGLTVAGPVTVEPDGGTVGPPPILVRDLTIRGGQTVTVTLPVSLTSDLAIGTVITNTASLSGTEMLSTSTSSAAITVIEYTLYLPTIACTPDT